MSDQYSQVGNYVAIAGLIVLFLNHLGVNILQTDVEAGIGALVTLYGIAHQFIQHKNLAISTGTYPK